MTETTVENQPGDETLVLMGERGPVTRSTIIAEKFDRQHQHVLRDIRTLECSDEFRMSNFGLREEIQPTSTGAVKKTYYEITRDGFMLLVMGFTGKKAMQVKEQFIDLFNELERRALSHDAGAALQIEKEKARIELLMKERSRIENKIRFREKSIETYVEDLAGLSGQLANIERQIMLSQLGLTAEQVAPPSHEQLEQMADEAMQGHFARLKAPKGDDMKRAQAHVRAFILSNIKIDVTERSEAAPSAYFKWYQRWIDRSQITPLPETLFFLGLHQVAQEVGLKIEATFDHQRILHGVFLFSPVQDASEFSELAGDQISLLGQS